MYAPGARWGTPQAPRGSRSQDIAGGSRALAAMKVPGANRGGGGLVRIAAGAPLPQVGAFSHRWGPSPTGGGLLPQVGPLTLSLSRREREPFHKALST